MTAPARSLKELFLAALEVAPADRAAWIECECGADAGLREHLNLMLAAHDAPQSLLDRPRAAEAFSDPLPPGYVGPTIDQPPTERPGTIIGPYKLLQQIGEGGMGTVFMAEQSHPVQRKVALKVIKAGMDSGRVIARFEAERQALALMDHPNIAKVLDAGTTEAGRPYFVMELVKGVPITTYCDENRLPLKARLELFTQVCQAVQHAHHKGVIHRDLKPTNVLVTLYDDKPVPKVIDFGVAKATGGRLTERTMFTGYGQIVGTLEYMSPEQARLNALDVDTRGDIYSLGVLLYELLTGTTPVDKKRLREAAFDEMLRMIREDEPPKPSTRLSTSESRASIAANRNMEPKKLSGLVRGELDWIVLKALEKDRNRRYETANGFALDVQRYLADEPVQACPPSAVYRLRKFARRNKAALTMVSVLTLALLLVVGSLGWMVRDRQTRQVLLDQEIRLALADVETWYRRDNPPETMAALKRAEGMLATGQANVELTGGTQQWRAELDTLTLIDEILFRRDIDLTGENQFLKHDAANDEFERAFTAMGIDVDALPVDEAAKRIRIHRTWERLTESLADWSFSRHMLVWGKIRTDKAWWQRLSQIARATDPHEFRSRVRLAVENEDRKEYTRLAESPEVLGLPASTLMRFGSQVFHTLGHQAGLRLMKKVRAQRPGDFRLNLAGARVHSRPGIEQWEEALRYAYMALAIRPNNPYVHAQLGSILMKQKNLDEAIASYRKAIELDPKQAGLHHSLGIAFHNKGELDAAIAAQRKAIELKPDYAEAHSDLGDNLRKKGLLDEAIASCRKAIELKSDDAGAHNNLGLSLHKKGQAEEAIACFRKAIELDPKYAHAYFNLGAALYKKGQAQEAIVAFKQAITLDPKDAKPHYDLGTVLAKQGNVDEAIDCFRKAIELDPKDAKAHYNLGVVVMNQGKLDEAITCYAKAIELDPKFASAHVNLGIVLADQGKLDEAIACYYKAIEFEPKETTTHNNLGLALLGKRRVDEAITCFRKAIEFDPKNAGAHQNLGAALFDQKKLDEAIASFRKAFELVPKNVQAHDNLAVALNELAWRLAASPDPKLRDPGKSVGLAEEAVRLALKAGPYWNTLGVAHYRAGNYKDALAALEQSMQLREGGDASDWFFLAMAHWQLGNMEEARTWYDRAVAWIEKNAKENEELRRFRTEAEELLGIDNQKP